MSDRARLKVWITRAQPGAAATAERVAALGFQPLVAPLLEVRALRPHLDLADVAALAFTSANGVRAFAALSARRDLPAFAVGDATAGVAAEMGFHDVRSASGDVAALARLIAETWSGGPVLHPAARDPAGDLTRPLAAGGLHARHVAVYETVAAPLDVAAVTGARIALLHSPRAATLAAKHLAAHPSLSLACLSPAVAARLPDRADVTIAATPDEAALLEALAAMAR